MFRIMSLSFKAALGLILSFIVIFWVRSYFFTSGWIISVQNSSEQPLRTDWVMLTAGRVFWNREDLPLPQRSRTPKEQGDFIGHLRYFKNERVPADKHAGWDYGIRKRTQFGLGFDALGITYLRYPFPRGASNRDPSGFEVAIPCLYLLILLAVPTTLTARRIIRRGIIRRRRLNGCCEYCGYDLRASPDRCPECGCPRIKTA